MSDAPTHPGFPAPDAMPKDAHAAHLMYRANGIETIPLQPRSKAPVGAAEGTKRFELVERSKAEPAMMFSGGVNIAVLLGACSGNLADIDGDVPEARMLLAHSATFAKSPAFGRAGQPYPGHYLCRYRGEGKTRQFGLTEKEAADAGFGDKAMIVEFRGDGGYTLVPPGEHSNGDRVVFTRGGELPEFEYEDVLVVLGRIAFTAVVLRRYPRTDGNRDNICMALTGTLIDAGLTDEETDSVVSLVAKLAGDEEHEKRGTKAAATRAKRDAGEAYSGLPKLLELLGIESFEKKARKWLSIAPPIPGALKAVPPGAVFYAPGRLADIIVETERALVAAEEPIYRRGPHLSRVARLESEGSASGVRRDAGSCVLLPVNALYMTERLARVAQVVTKDRKGRIVPTDPKPYYSSHVIARAGDWTFRPLRGIVNHPTLRPDLSLLSTPGYDDASGIIFDPCGVEFPPIADAPTRDDALAAIALFDPLLIGFPFEGVDDRAVALSAILTGLIRRAFPSAPIHGFDATTAGTGKTLLAETCGVIIVGRKPPSMTMGRTAEEFEKRLASSGLAGDEVLLIDNADLPLEGDFLCSFVSQEFVQTRILGSHQTKTLPAGGLVLVTGNNIVYSGDVSRRAVTCRMDAKVERPDLRQFNFDPRELAREGRGVLVAAGLTIVRAYVAAGRPHPLPKVGSFEDWNVVREAIAWLGYGDCAATRARIFEHDPKRNELAELLSEWYTAAGEDAITLADIRSRAESTDTVLTYQPLLQALIELSGRPMFNSRSIGKRLLTMRNRIVGGLMLRKAGERGGSAYWQVVNVQPPKGEPEAPESTPEVPDPARGFEGPEGFATGPSTDELFSSTHTENGGGTAGGKPHTAPKPSGSVGSATSEKGGKHERPF